MKKRSSRLFSLFIALTLVAVIAGCFTIISFTHPDSAVVGEQITVTLKVRTDGDQEEMMYGIIALKIPVDWMVQSIHCVSNYVNTYCDFLHPDSVDGNPNDGIDYWANELENKWSTDSFLEWRVYQTRTAHTSSINGSDIDVTIRMTVGSTSGTYDLEYLVTDAGQWLDNGQATRYDSESKTITITRPPDATTLAATNVDSTLAILNGTVNPHGLSTTVKFQYGTSTGYGNEVTAVQSPVSGSADVDVSALATELQPETLYHFRVAATSSAGTIYGDDQTFTTTETVHLADPVLYPLPGVYENAQQVTLTSEDVDVEIRFTRNGEDPTNSDSLYSTPISIASTTILKARAFKAGAFPSQVVGGEYTILGPDRDVGWVVGMGGKIYKSPDNGMNWIPQTSNTNLDLYSIFMIDDQKGFAVGDEQTILSTQDGGENWTLKSGGDDEHFTEIYFINQNIGWIVGYNGTILKTTDGGINWINPVSQSSESFAGKVWGFDFVDENYGWLTSDNHIFNSSDGGVNWKGYNTGLVLFNFMSLDFADQNRGIAIGASGIIMLTTDGGETWIQQPSGTTEYLVDVYMYDAQTAWIVGWGIVLKTTNGGINWFSPLSFGSTEILDYSLVDVHFNDQQTGWAVGARFIGDNIRDWSDWSSAVFNTIDGGVNWQKMKEINETALNRISFPMRQIEDGTPPYTADHNPVKYATDVLLDANIIVHVKDDTSGVDQSSIMMKVDGNTVSPAITGTSSDYTVTYNPPTDFNYNKTVTVSIDASDKSGNAMATDTWSFTTQRSSDVQSPAITIQGSVGGTVGEDLTISVNVQDDSMVDVVSISYRKGGGTSFTIAGMTTDPGSSLFQYSVPSSVISERGLEYYITATDTSGNMSTSPSIDPATSPHVVLVTFTTLNCPYTTPAGSYRMISVPVNLTNKNTASVIADDLGNQDASSWRLVMDTGSDYLEYGIESIPVFEVGNGYWLITKDQKNWDVSSGSSVSTAQNYMMTLSPGWNQVGHPFAFSVDWDDVVTTAGNVEPPIGYAGTGNSSSGYSYNQSRLEPWKGYYIKNLESSNVTIEVPPVASSSATSKQNSEILLAGEEDWMVRIKAECSLSSDWDNYIGCVSTSEEKWDRHDLSEAPPFGDYVSVQFPHLEWEKYPGYYTTDFRNHDPNGQVWDFEVRTNREKSEVKLFFENIILQDKGLEILLIDRMQDIGVDIRTNPRYRFLSGRGETVRRFQLIVGSEAFTRDNSQGVITIPDGFRMLPNYPNPFNASTLITYQLPEDGMVDINIYNSTGKLVRTLVRKGQKSAGIHTVAWHGREDSGRAVASGIYICLLKADHFAQTIKMLLLQ